MISTIAAVVRILITPALFGHQECAPGWVDVFLAVELDCEFLTDSGAYGIFLDLIIGKPALRYAATHFIDQFSGRNSSAVDVFAEETVCPE